MCACEPGFTCSLCRGTRLDPAYAELPDQRETDEAARYAGGTTEASEADDAA